jgi:hypothetical protein
LACWGCASSTAAHHGPMTEDTERVCNLVLHGLVSTTIYKLEYVREWALEVLNFVDRAERQGPLGRPEIATARQSDPFTALRAFADAGPPEMHAPRAIARFVVELFEEHYPAEETFVDLDDDAATWAILRDGQTTAHFISGYNNGDRGLVALHFAGEDDAGWSNGTYDDLLWVRRCSPDPEREPGQAFRVTIKRSPSAETSCESVSPRAARGAESTPLP